MRWDSSHNKNVHVKKKKNHLLKLLRSLRGKVLCVPTAGTHSPASEETAELLRVLAGCHRRGPNPRNPRKTPATKGLRTFFSPVIDVPGKTWAASL